MGVMAKFELSNLKTEIDWQLAYLASRHVERGKRNILVFETPNGDVSLSVQKVGTTVKIERLT